ncbi:MAG TPA: metallophosphoesterase [Thermogutta sp.]|nr:metallophosphoesterase [Thermogutta sp.]
MIATFEYIEQIVATCRNAARANEETPARRGNLIVLTPEDGSDVIITGDIHGNRRNFNLIRRVAALDKNPKRHLILQEVCHGGPTYPANAGCMSHTVLEDVAKLKVQYPDRVHFILGNHELSEVTDYPIQKNKQMLNLLFRLGLQHVYGPAADRVRESYLAFIKSCPLGVRLPGDLLVTHSLPEAVDRQGFDVTVFHRPLDMVEFLEHKSVFRLVWGRDYRRENAMAFARLTQAAALVHGHEPCPQGFATPNDVQLILDCSSDKAAYVMLPLDRQTPWTLDEVVARVQLLA